MPIDEDYINEHWPPMRDKLLKEIKEKGHVCDMIKVPPEVIEQMYAEAREAYAAEDYFQAEYLFQGMNFYAPSDPRGWLGYGGASEAQKKWEQAALAFGMAMALIPNDPVAAFRAGVCLMAMDKPEEAAAAFEAAASTVKAMRSQPKKLPYAERAASMLKLLKAKAR